MSTLLCASNLALIPLIDVNLTGDHNIFFFLLSLGSVEWKFHWCGYQFILVIYSSYLFLYFVVTWNGTQSLNCQFIMFLLPSSLPHYVSIR